MYWNNLWWIATLNLFVINRNMRCIEIETSGSYNTTVYRLIETWDVLKLLFWFLIP